MDNPAEVLAVAPGIAPRKRGVTFPPPAVETLGWGLLIAQLITVAVVYFAASTAPAAPIKPNSSTTGNQLRLIQARVRLAKAIVSDQTLH